MYGSASMRSVVPCLALLVCLAASTEAPADAPRRIGLDVVQGQGTASCMTEERLRRSLAKALGHDPVDRAAPDRLRVRSFRLPPADIGVYLELQDAEGAIVWQRFYQHPIDNCAGLIDSATLGVELALDRPSSPRQQQPASPPATPCPVSTPCPSCPHPRPCPPPPAPPDPSLGWSASFGAEALFGPLPGLTGGGALGVAFRWPRFAVNVDARISGPASTEVPEGEILAWLSAASIAPCYRTWALEGCILLSAGVLRGFSRGLDVPASGTLVYGGVGGRLATLAPLTQLILIRPYLDVVAPVLPIELVGGSETWMMPSVAAVLGVSAVFLLSSPARSPRVYRAFSGSG